VVDKIKDMLDLGGTEDMMCAPVCYTEPSLVELMRYK
jgi:hypothetical protein